MKYAQEEGGLEEAWRKLIHLRLSRGRKIPNTPYLPELLPESNVFFASVEV